MWILSVKTVAVLGIAIFCLFIFGEAVAQCVDYSENLHWVGQIEMPEKPAWIVVQGDFAYVANGSAGLQVVDLSNPNAPTIIAEMSTPEEALQIIIQDQYAYLRTGAAGFQVVDLSIPDAPEIVGNLVYPGQIKKIAIQGDYAYTMNGSSQFVIIDISNANSPQIVAHIDIPLIGPAHDFAIQDNFVFVTDLLAGLHIIDITNPLEAEVLNFVDMEGYFPSIIGVQGGFAYVYCLNQVLVVMDITNPTVPEVTGLCPMTLSQDGSNFQSFVFNEEYAYVSGTVLDLSSPASPVVAGIISTYRDRVAIWEKYVIRGNSNRLQVMDISTFNPVDHLSSAEISPTTTRIAVQGDFAYLTNYSMKIMDISQPETVTFVGEIDLPNGANRIAIQNFYAFVTGVDTINGSLQIVDVSSSEEPSLLVEVDIPGHSNLVEVQGDFAYVSGTSNLMVVDIATPENPYIIGSINTLSDIYEISLERDFIFLANGNSGLQIVETSSPANPTIVSSISVSGEARAVAVQDGVAFVIDWFAETSSILQVIDVSAPEIPQTLSSFDLGKMASFISVQGNYAYVGSGGDLQVLDITNPQIPIMVGNTPTRTGGGDLAIANSGVCMSVFFIQNIGDPLFYSLPFEIFPLQCAQASPVLLPEQDSPPLTMQLLAPYPNPFNPSTTISFDCRGAGPVNLSVFDLAGRRVSVLANKWLDAGRHTERWNGIDDFGRAVPTGQYFVRLKTSQGIDIQKALLVK